MQRYDYTAIAKTFHWLIALLIFVLFPLAWVMDGFSGLQKFQAYNLHKSLGITVLTLMALRLLWRLASPAPGLPSEMPALEQRAAHAGHFLLYLLLFLMPLSGWLMISASDKPSVLFQFTAFPLLPWIGDLPPDQKKYLAAIFRETHVLLSYTLLALVVIHIAAALRHAFLLHDGILSRMLPRSWGVSKATAAIVIAVSAAGLACTNADSAHAAQWGVDTVKSTVGFEANGSGYTATGKFGKYDAKIAFDPASPAEAVVQVTFDMKSAATGTSDVDSTLQSSDFFDVAKFPTAQFVAKGAKPVSGGHFILDGELTLKGKTKPVQVPFSIDIEGTEADAKAEAKINRLDFGVGPESVAGLAVDKDVKLTLDLKATKTDK